jgi:hypothetical protein
MSMIEVSVMMDQCMAEMLALRRAIEAMERPLMTLPNTLHRTLDSLDHLIIEALELRSLLEDTTTPA